MPDEECFFSLQEAANHARVTKQALSVAIKKGKLKAVKNGFRWCIKRSDLDYYRLNKYNRDDRKVDGKYVFDMEKGEFSANQVCKIISSVLGCPFPIQRLYYLMRMGRIKCSKKGAAWIIHKEEATDLLEKEIERLKKVTENHTKISIS